MHDSHITHNSSLGALHRKLRLVLHKAILMHLSEGTQLESTKLRTYTAT